MKLNKIFVIVAIMVIGMTVSSCDRLDNPVRYAEDLSISSEGNKYMNQDGQIEMNIGQTIGLIIVMDYYWTPTKAKFTWASSDTSVATVDENGMLKAVGNGTALITAQWTEDPSCQATVEVVVKDEQPDDDGIEAIIGVGDEEVSQDEAEARRFVFGK